MEREPELAELNSRVLQKSVARALMPPGTLIIRADASIAMGTGHVMRCLALAQAWQDEGGECIFAMAETTAASEERIRAEKFAVTNVVACPGTPQDAAQGVDLALAHHAPWIVVDGYQFDVEYQRKLKAAGLKLLVVDDTGHAGAYVADLVLDQNAHATKDLYQLREPYTVLLLGPRYALLRREFKTWRAWKREIAPIARKVLVTVGGTDPGNLTIRVIRALRMLADDKLQSHHRRGRQQSAWRQSETRDPECGRRAPFGEKRR